MKRKRRPKSRRRSRHDAMMATLRKNGKLIQVRTRPIENKVKLILPETKKRLTLDDMRERERGQRFYGVTKYDKYGVPPQKRWQQPKDGAENDFYRDEREGYIKAWSKREKPQIALTVIKPKQYTELGGLNSPLSKLGALDISVEERARRILKPSSKDKVRGSGMTAKLYKESAKEAAQRQKKVENDKAIIKLQKEIAKLQEKLGITMEESREDKAAREKKEKAYAQSLKREKKLVEEARKERIKRLGVGRARELGLI